MTKNILLVDKDKEALNTNKDTLTSGGFEVKTATSAQEALDSVKESKPDLVITEVMLEHVDSGFSLAYNLKKSYPDMQVFILSDIVRKTGFQFNVNTHEQRDWIKADEFIDKPVSPASLMCIVNKHFA